VGLDRFAPEFTSKMVKHCAKVVAWAAFSWKDRGSSEFLKKGEMMNGQGYRVILDEKLGLFMQLH
jgi:hypothetical protein